jgi:hypothetical protein
VRDNQHRSSVAPEVGGEWERLVASLEDYDVRHLSPGVGVDERTTIEPEELLFQLATAQAVRLREAWIPFLLRHPDLAPAAQRALARLDGDLRERAMRRYVVAAALQRLWRSRLSWTLGPQPLLPPAYLDELGLPSLELDFGRETLRAVAMDEERRWGHNAWDGYATLMDTFLAEIERKARIAHARPD